MKSLIYLSLIALAASLLLGCGGAQPRPEPAPAEAPPPAEDVAQAEAAPDAVSGATKAMYDKSEHWQKEDLIGILKDYKKWTAEMFWAMATVDDHGTPNITAIAPYALTEEVLVFANKSSVAKANVERTKKAHAIFRALNPETINPKMFDFFGIVGNRITLELVDDPAEKKALWKQYQEAGTPVSPPHFNPEDHFFMKIVEIVPIG